jgi:hypothetical protein
MPGKSVREIFEQNQMQNLYLELALIKTRDWGP